MCQGLKNRNEVLYWHLPRHRVNHLQSALPDVRCLFAAKLQYARNRPNLDFASWCHAHSLRLHDVLKLHATNWKTPLVHAVTFGGWLFCLPLHVSLSAITISEFDVPARPPLQTIERYVEGTFSVATGSLSGIHMFRAASGHASTVSNTLIHVHEGSAGEGNLRSKWLKKLQGLRFGTFVMQCLECER